MSDRRYRVAVVGGAGMWGRHYLRAAAEHERVDPILVDTSPWRHEFAAHHGVGQVYGTLDELLAREVPDVACCILPVTAAPAAVLRCVEAGARVVSCEKPIAVELATADRVVEACRRAGAAFGCATAHWEVPFLHQTAAWLAEGHLGGLTGAAIPGGLPVEVSGAGCVQLTQLRALTGMEVEWVEGNALPPVAGYRAPEADDLTADCPAYGRLGLSGGIECQVPEPRAERQVPCRVAVTAEDGAVFMQRPEPVILQGTGARATPVRPAFFDELRPGRSMGPVLQRLLDAVDSGAV